MTPTFSTGCSGIGAPEMAWGNRLGWKCLWCSEIEPFPSAVLKYRWPETPNLGDFMKLAEKIEHDEIEAPDVFIAGTPCQAFSVAGLRESLNDDRGGLTLEYCRIADAMDEQRIRRGLPETIFVWENVPGVFSSKDNAFGCFIAGLTGDDEPCRTPDGASWPNCGVAAGCRRQLAWRTLDAQFFGVAQRRRRVFVVCTARAGFSPAAGLFECGSVPRYSPPSREAQKNDPAYSVLGVELSDRIAYGIGNGQADVYAHIQEELSNTLDCMHDPQAVLCFENHAQDSRVKLSGDIAPTINGKTGTGGGNLPLVVVGSHWDDPVNPHPPLLGIDRGVGMSDQELFSQRGAMLVYAETGISHYTEQKISATIDQHEDQHLRNLIVHGSQDPIISDIANPIGRNHGAENVLFGSCFIRRLTTVECARLQGFPDHHTEVPWRGKAPHDCPKGLQYKAYGNSMCVNVIEWLGRMIEKELEHPSGVVLDPPPEQLEFDF